MRTMIALIALPVASFAQAELEELTVDAEVTDQVCVETYRFAFRNPTSVRIEHDFILPVDPDAQVTQFSMEMGGKNVEARMLDRDRAEQIYREIVRARRDPGLLEHVGRGMIRARIFPIEPNSVARIQLTLTRTLPSMGGTVALSSLYSLPGADLPVQKLRYTALLKSQKAIRWIYSPSHPVQVERRNSHEARVSFETEGYRMQKPLQVLWSLGSGGFGVTLLTHRVSKERGYFMLVVDPGIEVPPEGLLPKEIVFCVDTSGSMAGRKIEQAKEALAYCVQHLPERDRFTIVTFSSTVKMFRPHLVAAEEARKEALEYIRGLQASGATALLSALETSLALFSDSKRPKVLVFLTDGEPTVGITDSREIADRVRAANEGRASIAVFGVGIDVKAPLLDRIAYDSRGSTEYVLPDEDLSQTLIRFARKTEGPVLTDVSIRFQDLRVEEIYPRQVTTLYRDEQVVLVGRYFDDGRRTIVLTGRQGEAEVRRTFEVEFPEKEPRNGFLVRLWGGRKVGFLLGEIQRNGANPELVDEVRRLAKLHGIVTPYTSYLALEKEHRDRYISGRKELVLKQRPGDPVIYKVPEADYNETPNEEFHKARGVPTWGDKPFKDRSVYDLIGGSGKGPALCKGGHAGPATPLLSALRWLARHQSPDGSWNPKALHEVCGMCPADPAKGDPVYATALALLAYLGAGYTHLSKEVHEGVSVGAVIQRGVRFLLKDQGSDGTLSERPLSHIAAAFALSEAYRLTSWSLIRDAAQKAVERIRTRGGNLKDLGDSALGFLLFTLKSAESAGLRIDRAAYEQLRREIDSRGRTSMATSMRILWNAFVRPGRSVPQEDAEAVVNAEPAGLEGWLFACKAMFHYDGPAGPFWRKWTGRIRSELLNGFQAGECRGSWKAKRGRIESTALAVICLEAWYGYPNVFLGRGGSPAGSRWSEKEAEFHASRDASKLSRLRSLADLGEAGDRVRRIEGKTFRWVRGVWVDAAFDPASTDESRIKKIRFMSDEYNGLLDSDRRLARYLSVGADVVVVHEGVVYWIHE